MEQLAGGEYRDQAAVSCGRGNTAQGQNLVPPLLV